MGKPRDGPAYFRRYRAEHPAYAERDRARRRLDRRTKPRGDRTAEYAKRNAAARHGLAPYEPLPMIYPDLNHGTAVAFWEDELRMDLAQERALAVLEGRDPDVAASEYRRRELSWREQALPYFEAAS